MEAYGIHLRTAERWVKIEHVLNTSDSNSKKLRRAGRAYTPQFIDLDEALFRDFQRERSKYVRITKALLLCEARRLAAEQKTTHKKQTAEGPVDEPFEPGMSYVKGWCKRYRISWHRQARRTAKLSLSDMDLRLRVWTKFREQHTRGVPDEDVWNMDESAARVEATAGGTLEEAGQQARTAFPPIFHPSLLPPPLLVCHPPSAVCLAPTPPPPQWLRTPRRPVEPRAASLGPTPWDGPCHFIFSNFSLRLLPHSRASSSATRRRASP
jgi:hypothetical protein